MVREWGFSIIFILTSCFLFSQEGKNNFKRRGLNFQTQSLILFYYNKNVYEKISPHQTGFELKDNSFLYGINGELNYYFNSHLGTGIGFGYEKLSQPNIIYYPLYINIIGILSETKNTMYLKFNSGIHLGDVDKSGFMFRWGLGAKIKVFRKITSNIEFTYSFQNMYKTFADSNRPENYYNFKSIGLTIGIEIN